MKRIINGCLAFRSDDGKYCTLNIIHFVESNGLVEFIAGENNKESAHIPMIINSNGEVFWVIRHDKDGNNLYEKFPYKVEELSWQIEYVNEK